MSEIERIWKDADPEQRNYILLVVHLILDVIEPYKEALKPFADMYGKWMDEEQGGVRFYEDHEMVSPEYTRATYGDLRRAARLFKDKK